MLPEAKRKRRLIIVMLAVSLMFVALCGRMFYLQLVQGSALQQKALAQWTRNTSVEPKRGDITDRNGEILAKSGTADTVVLRPQQISNAKNANNEKYDASREIAEKLAPILAMDEETIYEKASDTSKQEVLLKQQITRDQSDAIRMLELPGVDFAIDTKRYYPKKELLTQVLGITSVDGVGLEGIEKYYDEYLAGEAGYMAVQIDREDNEMPFGEEQYVPARDGYTVEMSIDYVIQSILEKQAQAAYDEYDPVSVTAIAMDPKTGEVLGMTTKPGYDLNEPPRNDKELLEQASRNRTVTDQFDPGSVFKTFTTAAALEAGVVNEHSTFVCNGGLTVDGQFIKCHKTHEGQETLAEGLERSCNPVFMNLALSLGKERFYEYMDAFGFGKKTGIDSYGESTGAMQKLENVRNSDLARMGFGQSISSSAIQTVTAFSAVVNGGKLYEPTLMKRVLDSEGNVVTEHKPTVKSEPISESTSAQMRTMLQGVVDNGSGKLAQVEGYTVGGKTGTTQVRAENSTNPEALSDKHIASFIGFAPVEDPQIVVLFVVDQPVAEIDYGSQISAPKVGIILKECLEYMQVQPSNQLEGEANGVETPDVTGFTMQEASELLTKLGLKATFNGEGRVVSQMPMPGVVITAEDEIVLHLREDEIGEGDVVVPDLKGKTPEECYLILDELGLVYSGTGEGAAIWQSVTAGSGVPEGTKIKVEFSKE